jgi:hypothetical protein
VFARRLGLDPSANGAKWSDDGARKLGAAAVFGSVVVAACALSLLAITPRVVFWRDYPGTYEAVKVPPMLAQLKDPGNWDRALWTDPSFNASQTLRWRLLPPVVGQLLHLPPRAYLGLPWVGLTLLVGACLHHLQGRGVGGWGLLAVGVLVGTSSAFFSSSCALGYFDPFYLLALVIFTFTPSPVLAAGMCALGPWVDEKFLLMLPACLSLRWVRQPSWKCAAWFAAAISPYCLVRLVSLACGESSVARQIAMQGAVFADYAPALPLGWWYGFRLGWVAVGIGLAAAWRALGWRAGSLMAASFLAAVGAVSFLAWDTTRSIAMALPFLVAGAGERRLRPWLAWLAALNLLLPAAYVWCGHPVTVPLTSFLLTRQTRP